MDYGYYLLTFIMVFIITLNWIFPAIGGALAIIATFLTAFATLFTVREMKKSREQSAKPYLVILKPADSYEFRWIPIENIEINIKPISTNSDQIKYERPIFGLKNIGNGPAKNITIEWHIQGEKIETIVLNSELLQRFNAHIESNLMLTLTQKDLIRQFPCLDLIKSPPLSYCIASPTTDFIDKIKIPSEIMTSIGFRIIAMGPRPFGWKKGPKLKLAISYESFENAKQQRYFEIHSDFLPEADCSESHVTGKIEFTVKESNS